MSTLTITVHNKSPDRRTFVIFNESPIPAIHSSDGASDDSSDVWINSWGQAPEVNAGTGTTVFQIAENFYAVCGSAPAALSKGLVISSSNSENAKLATESTPGSNWKIDIPQGQQGLEFDTDSTDSTNVGGFDINTIGDTWVASDFPGIYCGLGRDDPTGESGDVVPVFVFSPEANQQYNINPTRKFWISYSEELRGLQTSIVGIGESVLVDFTGKTETNCTVHLEQNNSWTLNFSP